MRKKILAANWKMNLTQPEVDTWLATFDTLDWQSIKAEVRVYPSAIYLKQIVQENVHVGAQNVYSESRGAYTGEISIEQLQHIDVQSTLIGHSERRQIFAEDNAIIANKVKACAQAYFPFILCCGESLQSRESGEHLSFVLAQLSENLSQLSATQLHLLVIAYEPIWAIGTGLSANIAQVTEMHQAIRKHLEYLFGEAGQLVPILYGGSVNAENATAIFGCPEVDGALVGGAALDPHTFYQLWQALTL
jgi:triosephosphate isomerase (TIM)